MTQNHSIHIAVVVHSTSTDFDAVTRVFHTGAFD